jgi:hypothetical protein
VELKKGNEVIIYRNLGTLQDKREGKDKYFYHFHEDLQDDAPENTRELPIGSKGKVTSVSKTQIYVSAKDNDGEERSYVFHPLEIRLQGYQDSDGCWGKFPEFPFFSLAKKTPIIIFQDRLYTASQDRTVAPNSNYLAINDDDSRKAYHEVIASASISSLEKLVRARHTTDFQKIAENYLKEVIEEKMLKSGSLNLEYQLLDFILNKVFPYFRSTGMSAPRVEKLLGTNSVRSTDAKKDKKSEKSIQQKQYKPDKDTMQLLQNIEDEQFMVNHDIDELKSKKLDTLLGLDVRWDIKNFSKEYEPESLLGSMLEGRNVAIIDNICYTLVSTNDKNHSKIVHIDGKDYALVSPKPLEEIIARYKFLLSKQVRKEALQLKMMREKNNNGISFGSINVCSIIKKEAYCESDFGLEKDTDSDVSADNNWQRSYYVYIQVPEHVLKVPDDYAFNDSDEDNDDEYSDDDERQRKKKGKRNERYFVFDDVKLAISVGIDEDGTIGYSDSPFTMDAYEHPFSDGGSFDEICMGGYKKSKLNRFSKEEAISKLLIDARNILLSGYISAKTNPNTPFEDFDDRRITLSEIRKRKLPITNININKRSRT